MSAERDGPSPTDRPTVSLADGRTAAAPAADLDRRAALGRYIVLDRLGGGGMGVVYAAYDPELDRKLAIKVLRPDAAINPSRLLSEARALARLQHPNVIAVYDVGTFGERVFVAMELVDGITLREWLAARPRSQREILDVFVQAGRGLAAAHAVGLVHRDFKPANVLVGRDGRVRVVDFGLARTVATLAAPSGAGESPSSSPSQHDTVTRSGVLLGTPAYMAPEMFERLLTDARSDQFSFSVALYEALFGARPFAGDDMATIGAEVTAGRLRPPPKDSGVPAWLQKLVLRGLALSPEQRWPSMDALLGAMGRDPARIRRRWLGLGAVLCALGALAFGLRGMTQQQARVCDDARHRLAGVWDARQQQAVHAAFTATGKPYAESAFASIARALDAWTATWSARATDACVASRVRHEQSDELYDLRMECLGQRLREASAQIDLFTHADPQVVEKAVRMTSSLTSPGDCDDIAALREPVRPQADTAVRAHITEVRRRLATIWALSGAAKYKEALALATPAVADARALGYRPLEAETLVALGSVQSSLGDDKTADQTLEEATLAARAGRDALTEMRAWTLLVWTAQHQSHYADARARGRRAFAAHEALGVAQEGALARLLSNLGTVTTGEGKYAEALDYHQRALALREKVYGPDSWQVAASHEALAQTLGTLGRYDEAEREVKRALAGYERTLGPEHPEYGSAVFNLAYTLAGAGRYDEALTQYRRNVAIWEKSLGPEHPRLGLLLTNIGDILRIQGKYAEALVWDRRALQLSEKTRGPEHPDVGIALVNLGDVLRLEGHYDEALAQYRRAAAVWDKLYGGQHPYMAVTLTGMARTELERHEPARALPLLERAWTVWQQRPGDPPSMAETRFALACAEWEVGRDRARARRLATEARIAYASAKRSRELAEVDAWLESHR